MAAAKDSPKGAGDLLQERANAELAQGFAGVRVDKTPNENYTVAGVTAGKPTPETTRD